MSETPDREQPRVGIVDRVEREQRAVLGGRPGTMPEREWKRSYITGLDPESVAKLAETYRRNNFAADPKRRKR